MDCGRTQTRWTPGYGRTVSPVWMGAGSHGRVICKELALKLAQKVPFSWAGSIGDASAPGASRAHARTSVVNSRTRTVVPRDLSITFL